MCLKSSGILLSWLVFFLACATHAAPLTPPNEPKENSFYVCYKKCSIHHSVSAPLSLFHKLQYHGCVISRQPCNTIYVTPQNVGYQQSSPMQKAPCCPQNAKKQPKVICSNRECPKRSCSPQCCKQNCPETLKKFGWFNNYPYALNAFYRCAYL